MHCDPFTWLVHPTCTPLACQLHSLGTEWARVSLQMGRAQVQRPLIDTMWSRRYTVCLGLTRICAGLPCQGRQVLSLARCCRFYRRDDLPSGGICHSAVLII
jgi:hypothetical protein